MDQYWLAMVAPMGVILVCCLAAMRQFDATPAGKWWATSWLLIYLDGVLWSFSDQYLAALATAQLFGLGFALLTFEGAQAFSGTRVARVWRIAPGLLGLLAIAVTLPFGDPAVTAAVGLIQGPLLLAAALLVWRGRARDGSAAIGLGLAAALAALGVNEIVDVAIVEAGYVSIELGIWLSLVMGTVVLEITTLADRAGRRESQLRRQRDLAISHAERMQSLATLAGGLAHDFNNQLTSILGNAELVAKATSPDAPGREALRDVQAAAEHCAELTRRLLTFASRRPAAAAALDLGPIVAEAEALIRPTLAPDIAFEVNVDDVGPVIADAMDLRRVLVNLLMNARDAAGPSGSIQLRVRRGAESNLERWAEIEVSDDGIGMDERTRSQAFDPFFTTKAAGAGTGLGLAVVYGIVEAHGGSIELESAPARGSTVRIRWPLASENELPVQPRVDAPVAAGPLAATVLLAEDEPAIRRVLQRALENAGCRVLPVKDGEEAQRCFERHQPEIEIAILDVSMPVCTGLDALLAIRRKAPQLPAVLISGHPDRVDLTGLPADVPLIAKPFRPDELLVKARQLLGERSSTPR